MGGVLPATRRRVWRGWFCDKATSSKIAFARRPEAEKLLQLVEPGDNIVISKLDRLGEDAPAPGGD